jgi:hypothetical protein
MNVHVAKIQGTFQKTIGRHKSAIGHSDGVHCFRCIHLLNALFSFDVFFEHKKYFVCQVKTNGGRYRDDKKENNLYNQFNIFFHVVIIPMIKIAINAARNPAIKPC